ncbi:uncharacterized protein LOC121193520%2C partial, partial [Scomber scombrus]
FGTQIQLTVEPHDNSTVEPTLFVLNPLQPADGLVPTPDKLGPDVCLATNFRPKHRDIVLNLKGGDSQRVNTSNAVISVRSKKYYHASFINRTILSCEMYRTDETGTKTNETATSANNDNLDLCVDFHPEKAKLNYFLLVMNGVRVVFTKTLAFNTLLTIRAAFF